MPVAPADAARFVRDPASGWRTAGLRPVLTVLSTGLVALVSALLLWLGWLLAVSYTHLTLPTICSV